MKEVALIPDRFAHYRYPVFKKLTQLGGEKYSLHIYADAKQDESGIDIPPLQYVGNNLAEGGVCWQPVSSMFVRGICFWQTGLLKLAASNKYDVLVFWGDAYRLSTWLSAFLARVRGKKVVFWSHGLYGKESRLKLFIRKIFYRIPHAMLLYGYHSKALLVSEGFDEELLYVINNSLDVEHQATSYQRALTNSSFSGVNVKEELGVDCLIIFVGRIVESKKIELILDCVKSINSSGEMSLGALFVGGGDYRSNLESLSLKLNISDKVRFYGPCYDHDILAALYMQSDICVSPGNVGLTAMQSLIFGTPVVTHNDMMHQMPESESVREGITGALFSRDDVNSLVAAVKRCLKYIDDGLVTEKTCRELIFSEYTPEYQAKVFHEMLDGLEEK
ncbi:glycosyltransferase [Halomonas sp. SSL-5]|uniref:glycosyltransferase family 4 protein n=1 Tax=Halomonas sp. SSL-5 TaxID=3065855 RepID=UPI00273A1F08|nr:glycosyltransferase [Halomonas sp. SSL-5]MDY7116718.1 glycosyltransferase [Halomonas sp. SSL-5]